MNPEQWGRLREIFFAVCQAPVEEREKVLASLCDGDAELISGVRELLDADDGAFLEQPALGRVLSEVALNEVGEQSLTIEQIGPYRIARKLGEGGMGTVFEADQEHPRRKVALKVLRPGVSSPQMLRRFRQEADLLGQLQHPGIARIYDAGIGEVTCKGQVIGRQPYFAMELVRGVTITEYVRDRKPTTREIMKLMALVADAVQHAHQNGVIHRDLKPGNILIDTNGEPKVLDFGVARPLDALQTQVSLQTQTGQIVGTLAYMSPEQVGGDSASVDTRSDVYSLGVILYELLAGKPPHDVRGLTLTAAIRIIRDKSPDDLERVRPDLRGDVTRIVAKAMEKERERRYQSAGAFAEDMRRYLADQPVLARPTSAIYQLRKFARRNKTLVGGAIATMISLLIGMAGIVWFAIGESRARTEAESASKKAMRLAHRVSIAAAGDAIERQSFSQARSLLLGVPENERHWEWRYFWNQLDNSYMVLEGATGNIRRFQFVPNSSLLLARSNGSLIQWDLSTRVMTRLLQGFDDQLDTATGAEHQQAAFSLDLAYGIAIGNSNDIKVLNLHSGLSTKLECDVIKKSAVALNSDGSRIAVGGEDGQVQVLSRDGDTKPLSFKFTGEVRSLVFAPKGRCLAVQTSKQAVVFDIDSGETLKTLPVDDSGQPDPYLWLKDGSRVFSYNLRLRGPCVKSFQVPDRKSESDLCGLTEDLTNMVITPDERYLLGCQYDGKVRMWDLASREIIRTFNSMGSAAFGLAIHPNGQYVAVGNLNGLIQVFDVATGKELGMLRGMNGGVASLGYNADGSILAAGSIGGAVRLWRTDTIGDRAVLRGHTSYVYPVAFSPDGKTVASGSWDNTIRLWDTSTGRELKVFRGHKNPIFWLSFSPDGTHLLSFTSNIRNSSEQNIWDINTAQLIAQSTHPMSDDTRPVFCRDQNRVWMAYDNQNTVSVWNYKTNSISHEPLTTLQGTRSPWISPDQRTLARFNGDEGRLELVDITTGQARHSLGSKVKRVAFSPDSSLIAALPWPADLTAKGNSAEVWNVSTGQKIAELRHDGGAIYDIAFSPDGTRIVTCGIDKLIHFWDTATFEETIGLRGHTDYVWSIAWSPDGSILASGSGDSTVRLWKSENSAPN